MLMQLWRYDGFYILPKMSSDKHNRASLSPVTNSTNHKGQTELHQSRGTFLVALRMEIEQGGGEKEEKDTGEEEGGEQDKRLRGLYKQNYKRLKTTESCGIFFNLKDNIMPYSYLGYYV